MAWQTFTSKTSQQLLLLQVPISSQDHYPYGFLLSNVLIFLSNAATAINHTVFLSLLTGQSYKTQRKLQKGKA